MRSVTLSSQNVIKFRTGHGISAMHDSFGNYRSQGGTECPDNLISVGYH